MTHGWTERLAQAAQTDQEGKGIEVMLTVKTHRQVAGDIDPQGHIVFLARGGIARGQLVQDLPLGDGAEEIGFADFPHGLDIIELAAAKGLQHPRIVALQ